ncbi:unnamed protein product, partial [Amoebophrya sp. A25]|eukprot:GSA25T00000885001.1
MVLVEGGEGTLRSSAGVLGGDSSDHKNALDPVGGSLSPARRLTRPRDSSGALLMQSHTTIGLEPTTSSSHASPNTTGGGGFGRKSGPTTTTG